MFASYVAETAPEPPLSRLRLLRLSRDLERLRPLSRLLLRSRPISEANKADALGFNVTK